MHRGIFIDILHYIFLHYDIFIACLLCDYKYDCREFLPNYALAKTLNLRYNLYF